MNYKRNSRVGIVGGTFNPIHNAHLSIAGHFLDDMRLDIVYFVPANISPFKTDNYTSQDISSEHRIKMLELALKDYKKFSFDTFETDKGDVSYTIDTVKYFREKFPYSRLFLLIGDDQA
ncbi:MAG: adenylyltransferase/cytidyltransferase family protein, partial [Ignavibacteria bacterium]|nr:adenylyltransferase/cytidyltransferase family protein [Ignavibacteria bacterium]